jgi:hypothetical protein
MALAEVEGVASDVIGNQALDYKQDNWYHKSLFWNLLRLGSSHTRFVRKNLDLLAVEMM